MKHSGILLAVTTSLMAGNTNAVFPSPFGNGGAFPGFHSYGKGVCRDNLLDKEFICNTDALDLGMGENVNEDVYLKFMTQAQAANSVDDAFKEIFPFQNQAVEEIFIAVVERDDPDHEDFDFFETHDYFENGNGGGNGGHGSHGSGHGSGHGNRRNRPGQRKRSERDIVAAGVCACILNEPSVGLPPFVQHQKHGDDDFVESPSKFVCFLEEDNIANSTLWREAATSSMSIYDIFGAWDFTSTLSGSVQKDDLRAFGISATLKDTGMSDAVKLEQFVDAAIAHGHHGHAKIQPTNQPHHTLPEKKLDHFKYVPYTRTLLDCQSTSSYEEEGDFLFPSDFPKFPGGK